VGKARIKKEAEELLNEVSSTVAGIVAMMI
jgi:hypothetical protein